MSKLGLMKGASAAAVNSATSHWQGGNLRKYEVSDPLLSDQEGADVIGWSRSTFRRRVADGTLPPPIRIGGMSRWRLSDIEKAIEKAERASRDAA